MRWLLLVALLGCEPRHTGLLGEPCNPDGSCSSARLVCERNLLGSWFCVPDPRKR